MVVELDNYILGSRVKSDKKAVIRDVNGEESAIIYDASPSHMRRVKREFPRLLRELNNIPVSDVIILLKKAMVHYYEDIEDLKLCSLLTGSPLWFLQSAVLEVKDWVANIEDYLRLSLGHYDYERIPIVYEGQEIAYQSFIATSPLIAILPRNSELESSYVIIQSLLARAPLLIKGPSQQGSTLSSLELIRCLEKVASKEHNVILESINIVNIIEDDKSMIMERLAVNDAIYIIFGSNNTIAQAEQKLSKHNPRRIVKMGTGFSVSVAFEDANIGMSVTEICDSASIDRGNDCISTNIVYAHESIVDDLQESLLLEAPKYEAGHPLSPTKIGMIEPSDANTIVTHTAHLDSKEDGNNNILKIFRLDKHHHFMEYPGPVLGIRPYKNNDELLSLFLSDLKNNNMTKNLVTSVFTDNDDSLKFVVRNFPSHMFKHNRGSHKMNFLLEHQGLYLIREMLERKIVEVEE
ncbi:MAG: aldehyde dehydrogenase family protein [Candidatus Woesearchaeota archaeon]